MLQCSPFPLCCGINVINGFSGTLERTVKDDVNLFINRRSTGVYLIALNGTQKKVYDKVVRELEFEPMIEDFVNPIHNSTITLYGRAVIGKNVIPELFPQKLPNSIFKAFPEHALNAG